MTPTRVIDMWAPVLPVPAMMDHMERNFPKEMLGYLRVFLKQETSLERLRERFSGMVFTEELAIQMLDQARFARSLITGFDEKSSVGTTFMANEPVAQVAERYPGRFLPFAGADVLRGREAVKEFEGWVKDRGFRGLSLRPFMINLPADDRRYYPFYEKCVELDVPVSLHTSANWSTMRINDLGHPRHIDPVAADFPDLKIIMSHGGYPWVLEAVLLAWKYPNVYLELAAHRPRYLARPGTGWEPLLTFGATTIRDKVLFGTGWFLLARPPGDLVAEFRELPVPEPVMERWLYGNAARLFGLEAR